MPPGGHDLAHSPSHAGLAAQHNCHSHHDPHDVKRPKHVVLSDTIAMVKELQERVSPLWVAVCRVVVLRREEAGGRAEA